MHSPCHPRCHNSARFPYGSRCFRPPPVLHSTSPYIHCFDRPTVVELNVEQSVGLKPFCAAMALSFSMREARAASFAAPFSLAGRRFNLARSTAERLCDHPDFFLCEKRLLFLCDCGGRAYCFKGAFQLRKLPPAAPPGSITERVFPDEVPFEVEPPSHPKPMKTPIGVEWGGVMSSEPTERVKNLTKTFSPPPQTAESTI